MPLPALALALGKKLLAKKVVEKAGSALQRKAKPTKKKPVDKKVTNKKPKKKKIKNTGQVPQPAQGGQRGQAPQGANSTFNSNDSSFKPNIGKKKPLKRALVGKQNNLPENIKSAIKAAPTKRYCGGKSKPFKRTKKY